MFRIKPTQCFMVLAWGCEKNSRWELIQLNCPSVEIDRHCIQSGAQEMDTMSPHQAALRNKAAVIVHLQGL